MSTTMLSWFLYSKQLLSISYDSFQYSIYQVRYALMFMIVNNTRVNIALAGQTSIVERRDSVVMRYVVVHTNILW